MLEEIVTSKEVSANQAGTSDGHWYLASVEVQGHVGVGETPLSLGFPVTNGITVISARNGTGKTSAADAMRHLLSNGRQRSYELAERNIHCENRSIKVVVSNGVREIEVSCGNDGTVEWREGNGPAGPVPTWWMAAFERYLPVLLYPEISPVIERPGTLHEFLKDALSLGVLQELLKDLDIIRKIGRDSEKAVTMAYQVAVDGVKKSGVTELLVNLGDIGATPDPDKCCEVRALAANLPSSVPPRIDLVDGWGVNDALSGQASAAIGNLQAARARTIQGVATVQVALDKLLAEEGEYLSDLRRRDVCPVCQTSGAAWATVAAGQAAMLRQILAEVRAAERTASQQIKQMRSCLPPPLPARTREAVVDFLGTEASALWIERWERLVSAGEDLSVETATATGVEALLADANDLVKWYEATKSSILSSRDVSIAERAGVRALIDGWLDALDGARGALVRAKTADRLAKKVDGWIKTTRTDVFEPIGDQVTEIWAALNSDADLELNGISLAGGVRQAGKVNIDLSASGTSVPAKTNKPAVLSTGQRNVLSLATYLPRATQPHSPFRFLVLDDPIHAFDDWRVRYLAKYLVALADRYQIIIFTHDDRLWRELRSLGYLATHFRLDRPTGAPSHVRVKNITRPGEQLLDEIKWVLDAESREALGTAEARTSMTLAMCRQAVDTEVVTQLEILARRLELTDEQLQSDANRAKKTRDQLDLLNRYARRAGLNQLDYRQFNPTITALNAGAHGRAPAPATMAQCRKWLKQSRELVTRIHTLTR
ncbi:hypothetical protein ACNTMW_33395 [Planosporangium sp. 12N6]|uniref:hypothetical protein n=1 Tax=Planosporangium spinosum TaxID=3402278 RepID=UPI003CEA6901